MASSTMGPFLHQVAAEQRAHAGGVCVRARIYGDAVEVAAGWDGRPATPFLVGRFQGPVPEFQCIDGHDGRGWHMVAGVPPYPRARHDPFARLLELLARHGGEDDADARTRGARRLAKLRRQHLRTRLAPPLRSAAAAAVTRCAPEILEAVRRYPPSVRFGIYRRIAAAPSSHARTALLQLTRTCPAVLSAAAALGSCRKRRRPLAEGIVARAVESPPLAQLADDVVGLVWSDPYPPARRKHHLPDPWEHARTLQGPERTRAMLAHRQLLRRAGPRVPPAYLVTPPPLAFSLDDIPHGVWDNAAWYRTMMGAACTRVPPADDRSAGRMHGWLAFLSKHGPALARGFFARTEALFGSVPNLVEALFLLADLADLRLDRRTPRPLVEALLEAHASNCVLDPLLLDRESIVEADRFDVDDAPVLCAGRVRLEPIRGEAALLLEGTRMRNCAASLADDCRKGSLAVCTVRVEGRRHMAAFRRSAANGWELVELKAPANLPVRPSDLAAVVRAVEDGGYGVHPRLLRAPDRPADPAHPRPPLHLPDPGGAEDGRPATVAPDRIDRLLPAGPVDPPTEEPGLRPDVDLRPPPPAGRWRHRPQPRPPHPRRRRGRGRR